MGSVMARKVVLIDDMDSSEIVDGDGGGTVTFSLNDDHFEMDLSSKNIAKLTKALDPFVSKASKVEAAPPEPRSVRPAKAVRRAGAKTDKEQLQAMREWLRAQGHEVSDRGRVAQSLQDLYNQAHG